MLYTIAVVLLILWALGLVSSFTQKAVEDKRVDL